MPPFGPTGSVGLVSRWTIGDPAAGCVPCGGTIRPAVSATARRPPDPGLSLHGRAQKDLLKLIDQRLAPRHQVIYTSHSPGVRPRPAQQLLDAGLRRECGLG